MPQQITTQDDFVTWLRDTLPEFSESDIAKVLRYYPVDSITESANAVKFATNGVSGPSALDQSPLGTGQQQRADVRELPAASVPSSYRLANLSTQNFYAELTFVCPSYWMAEAYSGNGRTSYKYEFSTLSGVHGADVGGYFGPLGEVPYLSTDFQRAFMQIWGNFVTQSNPSIPASVAAGSSNGTATTNVASQWPVFSVAEPYQLVLNQTGGQLFTDTSRRMAPVDTTYFVQPGLVNNFTLGNTYTWEGGRGVRCDFLRSMADIIPA